MTRDIDSGIQSGFFAYITKPINVKLLMDTLDLAMDFAGNSARHRK